MQRAARWSDDDKYFGPFTWSYSSYSHCAVVLKSRGDDDESGVCSLRISIKKATLIIALPEIIRPHRTKVYPTSWDAQTIERLGRNWYWDVDQRAYGFNVSDGHLSVYYGRSGGPSGDSSTEQRWGCFLPWTQWRHVRHSLYGIDGEHFYTGGENTRLGADGWKADRDAKDSCPTVKFTIEDFDGEEIAATTLIEEREWHFGTGWFRWLSWFRPRKIKRSLDIAFSKEIGPEKGSWKGGTVGTGIEMLAGEDHESAFRRFCDNPHRSKYRPYSVKFLSRIT